MHARRVGLDALIVGVDPGYRGRQPHHVQLLCGCLGDVRERNRAPAEARRARVAQERGLHNERRIRRTHPLERSVERRHHERLPKRRNRFRRLPLAHQPLGKATLKGTRRANSQQRACN